MLKTYKYRIYPTQEQKEQMQKIFGQVRFVYNLGLETIPILPFLKTKPGMIPTLASPGVIIPGQLGPIRREFLATR